MISYKKISCFHRGILRDLLTDAYSFDRRFKATWYSDWQEFDDFFFDNLWIADKCGFITTLNDEAIGFVSWDPRNRPEYTAIGHNCIVTNYKGRGYGRLQLKEGISRITQDEVQKIIVSTNETLKPAQKMYESVGFLFQKKYPEPGIPVFAGDRIDYLLPLNDKPSS